MGRRQIELECGPELLLRATALCREPRRGAEIDGAWALSRFVRARFEPGAVVLESPASDWRVELTGAAAPAAVAGLATPGNAGPPDSDQPAERLAAVLAEVDMVVPVDSDGTTHEPGGCGAWEHHDLALHHASRLGRGDPACGARSDVDTAAIPPATEAVHGEFHELRAPAAPVRGDFAEVLDARRCVRDHGPRPLEVAELGEFLYRTSRVTWMAEEQGVETAGRPYPSGGGAYELEVYCVVRRCEGLASGLYRYVPDRHGLETRSRGEGAIAGVLADARAATGAAASPQVVVVITSRFGRLSARYRGLAYAMTLKNVGVLMQTMCLTAQSMGLAACPLGTGNSEAFAAVAGADPLSEPAVGELSLGAIG